MVNQATLLGRVGKVETKTTSTGMKVSNLSMVTSKKYTKNGQKEEKSTWHNITLFSKLAEICEKYISSGDMVFIQGEMENQKYTDTNGIERYKSFVIAHEIKMLPKTKEHKPSANTKSYNEDFKDDQVPW